MLSHRFYAQDVTTVAPQLLGQLLVRDEAAGRTSGIIVEVEAYLHEADPASHSFRGPTRRNASMFGPAGRAYVYTIHTRFCVNVVTGAEGIGAAVLIRAVEPVEGIERMRQRRHVRLLKDLVNGPGKLCQALDIDRRFDGWDLTRGEQLWIEPGPRLPAWSVTRSPRIGINVAADLPLRFYIDGNPFVSGPKRQHQTPPRAFFS